MHNPQWPEPHTRFLTGCVTDFQSLAAGLKLQHHGQSKTRFFLQTCGWLGFWLTVSPRSSLSFPLAPLFSAPPSLHLSPSLFHSPSLPFYLMLLKNPCNNVKVVPKKVSMTDTGTQSSWPRKHSLCGSKAQAPPGDTLSQLWHLTDLGTEPSRRDKGSKGLILKSTLHLPLPRCTNSKHDIFHPSSEQGKYWGINDLRSKDSYSFSPPTLTILYYLSLRRKACVVCIQVCV